MITQFFKMPPRIAGFAYIAYRVGLAFTPWNMLNTGMQLANFGFSLSAKAFRNFVQFVYYNVLPGWVLDLVRTGSVIVSWNAILCRFIKI
jgi:hypothetical protein